MVSGNSAAISANRSGRPSAQRYSTVMLRPSIRRLLRTRRERPRGCRAAEQRDELAALHCQSLPCFDGKIAHLVRQETAALRDFYPAYDPCGSVAVNPD